MRNMQMKRAALALALLCAFGSTAMVSAGEAPKTKKVQIDVPAANGGLVGAVDPATGGFRQPTAAELQSLSQQMNKMLRSATAEVTITEYADGTISADLGDSFMNMTIVRLNPNGTASEACVETVDAANQFFAATATPASEDR